MKPVPFYLTIYLIYTLILSSHISLCLQNGLLSSGFPIKILYTYVYQSSALYVQTFILVFKLNSNSSLNYNIHVQIVTSCPYNFPL
jgi:hypothetical protein